MSAFSCNHVTRRTRARGWGSDGGYEMTYEMPVEIQERLKQLREIALARNQGKRGLIVWTLYLQCADLYAFAPEVADGKFANEAKRAAALLAFLQKNNMIVPIVALSSLGRAPDGAEAQRAYEAMLADEAAGRKVRKPVTYMVGNADGVTVAIAIDDRFWDYASW